MKHHPTPLRTTRRGGVLVAALLATSIVFVLAMGVIQLTNATSGRAAAATDRKNALELAEAGLAEAYAGLCVGKTGNVGTPQAPAAIGEGAFWVEVEELDDEHVFLESTALYGMGRATLGLTVERVTASVEGLGVHSGLDVTLPAGTFVDSFDSSLGTYAEHLAQGLDTSSAVVSTGGSATLLSGAVVQGDVSHDAGGTATVETGAVVSGSVGAATTTPEMPPIEFPDVEQSESITVGKKQSMVLPPGTYGATRVELLMGSDTVITGPSVVLLDELVAEMNSSLTLDARGGPVDVYVTGTVDLDERADVSTDAALPSDVTLQIGGALASLAATGSFLGQIYAPDCEVRLGAGFELFGGVVADQLVLEPGAQVHLDVSDATSRESRLPHLLSWRVVDVPDAVAGGSDAWTVLGLDPAALPSPAEAHQDQQLELEYVAHDGVTYLYSGWESAFDWSTVGEVLALSRDGVAVREVPPATEDEGGAWSPAEQLVVDGLMVDQVSDLHRIALLEASPLSDGLLTYLLTLEPQPLEPGHLKQVMVEQGRLSERVLLESVKNTTLASGHVTQLALANLPISDEVLGALLARTPPLDPLNLATILAAQ